MSLISGLIGLTARQHIGKKEFIYTQTNDNMKTYSVNGTYGSSNTPCIVFVAQFIRGCWYCVEGSQNVNFTEKQRLSDGTNVEELNDTDCFTWSSPILSLEDLEEAVEN